MDTQEHKPGPAAEPVEGDRGQEAAGAARLLQLMLSPQALQGLMSLGGVLLVLGLVVWLWSVGFFANPITVAVALGLGNAAILAGGCAMFRYTRFQTAGRAIALLGCVLLPLNLWFYDAQGLITLDQGGHLWAPALVCCVIYAGVAWLLRDAAFVYTLVAGVTLTGLLILADQRVDRFWEVTAPSTLLVVLGMAFVHAERLFVPGSGDFSREKFGRAFFRAGHAVMAAGLATLLCGRLTGWLYEPLLSDLRGFELPGVATVTSLKLTSLALALAGAYTYVYSIVVVDSKGRYVWSAALALLWSFVILLDVLQLDVTHELVMVAVSVVSIGASLAGRRRERDEEPSLEMSDGDAESSNTASAEGERFWEDLFEPIARRGVTVASGLNGLLVVLAVALYARAGFGWFDRGGDVGFDLAYLGAMLSAASAFGAAAWTQARQGFVSSVRAHLGCLSVVGVLTVAGGLAFAGLEEVHQRLPVEALVPLAMAGWARYRNHSGESPWYGAAGVGATLLLVIGCFAAVFGSGENLNLLMGFAFAATAATHGLSAMATRRRTTMALSAIGSCLAVWELLLALGFSMAHAPIVATTAIGLLCLGLARTKRFARLAFAGQACVTVSAAGAVLLTLARVISGEVAAGLIWLLAVQSLAAVGAVLLSREADWRRHFSVMAGMQAVALLIALNSVTPLNFLQRAEMLVAAIGAVLLAVGHIGWSKEAEEDQLNHGVSLNLGVGSLMVSVPACIALLAIRFFDAGSSVAWVTAHEVGVLLVGLALLGSGVLCRIRWTTLCGAGTLTCYVLSLAALLRLPEQLQSTAVYMMAGGGAFFAAAVLLSVYRDRILSIPDRARSGEGVFRVLKWR
ncbi:MAG: hypothetical protein AAGA92_13460 [Planctomycetota bacterium]